MKNENIDILIRRLFSVSWLCNQYVRPTDYILSEKGNIMVWKLNFSDEVYITLLIYTILWAGNWSLMSEFVYIMYVIKLINITPLQDVVQYVDNTKTLLVMTWIFECRLVLLLWQWVVSIWRLLQSKNELLPFVGF